MSLARFRVTVLAVAATAVTTFGYQEATVLQPPVFQKGPDGSPARPQEALAAFTAAALAVPADSQSPGQATPATDGFIRQWLVLAPIPLESESGATEIDIDLLGDEGQVTPTAGDALAFGNQVRRWTPYQAPDFFIDFLSAFGQAGGDYMGGYAVAYVWAESEMEVTLAVGTNDQGKAWLNGKEVIRFAEARGLEQDADRAAVTLAKGRNVLVLKVINEVNNWQACARFLRAGVPVTNLTFGIDGQQRGQ